MKVAVLTTSYPRHADDHAGLFIADAVDRLRARGVEIEVLAPGSFRDFGLAYGDGVARNVRRRPWAAPLLLGSMALSARRSAARVDLVHAHWLPAGAAAVVSAKPLVVTLHGTDVEVARRVPPLARAVLRRAAVTVCVSRALAEVASRLGARRVEVIPNGVALPPAGSEEVEPAEILYIGRLSPEKGVEELAAAARGLNLVVIGDGPMRDVLPRTLGFLPREEVARRLARAAIVVCPSRREGFGMTCAEAMAHAKPVVATGVGGLRELVVDGETGLLVPPRDPGALRAAIERLLADRGLRHRLGAAGRERVAALCSWERVVERTLAVYRSAYPPEA